MSLLLTAPYDPWKQTAWVGDLIRLSAQMREERAKREQQAEQQALADHRRAFEFDRRLEFERARTAADDTRADARLAMERDIFNEDRAPFVLPPSLGNQPSTSLPSNAPSASLPAVSEPVDNSGALDGAPSWLPPAPAVATMPPAGQEDQFDIDPVTGDPKLVKAGANTVGADMAALPRDARGRNVVSGGVVTKSPSASLPTVAAPTGLSGEPTLFPAGGVPAGATTAGSHVAALARDLAGTGLFTKKQAGQILTQSAAAEGSRKESAAASLKPQVRNFADGSTRQYDAATDSWVTLAKKQTAEPETLQDAIGTATYNKDHNTYVREDGSEFFPQRSANGRWMQRPFTPSQKPAKLTWGDDGNVYPIDSQGNLLKPKPDGVQLRDHAQLQTVDVKGVGRMIVNPDQSTRLLIPEGVPLTAKQRDKYTEDAQALRAAQVDLDAQTKLKAENPSKIGVTWFGGGTQAAVDEAQKKRDAAAAAIDQWHKDWPQLATKNIPPMDRNTGGTPKVTTQAEYDALPPGAAYFDAEGRRATKRAAAPATPAPTAAR